MQGPPSQVNLQHSSSTSSSSTTSSQSSLRRESERRPRQRAPSHGSNKIVGNADTAGFPNTTATTIGINIRRRVSDVFDLVVQTSGNAHQSLSRTKRMYKYASTANGGAVAPTAMPDQAGSRRNSLNFIKTISGAAFTQQAVKRSNDDLVVG